MLAQLYDVQLQNVADTMTQELVLTCGNQYSGYSLVKLAEKYLGVKYAKTNQLALFGNNEYVGTLSKDTRKTFRSIGERPFNYDQVFYGLCDVELTFKVYQKQI